MSLLSLLRRPSDLARPVNNGVLAAGGPLRAGWFQPCGPAKAQSEHQTSEITARVYAGDDSGRAHLWMATEGRCGTWCAGLPIPIGTVSRRKPVARQGQTLVAERNELALSHLPKEAE